MGSKIIDLNTFKLQKLSTHIEDLKEGNYVSEHLDSGVITEYDYLLDFIEALEMQDLESISFLCLKYDFEFSIYTNHSGSGKPYTVMLNTDPLVRGTSPSEVSAFMSNGGILTNAIARLADELKLYHSYMTTKGDE